MAYFNKYYIEFTDSHPSSPVNYRIDIMDSVGVAPTEPFRINGATPTLKTVRINDTDDKISGIIGREITISYIYTGSANDPIPDDFFDAEERRFRVEVRMNGILDGVYFVRPDFSSFPYDSASYVVQIKAVDGLSFAKGVLFNMEQDNLLFYDRATLYQSVMTRALSNVLDADTKLNVLNSLYPVNLTAGLKLFFECYIHTDNFFDFTEGPKSVYDALMIICTTFRFTLFIEQNTVWLVRLQDLTYDVFSVDQYTNESTADTLEIDMVASVGPGYSYDAIPINVDGERSSRAAIKRVQYFANYRSVNRLVNFDWRDLNAPGFDGFLFWGGPPGTERRGTGTVADPYRAFMPYDNINPGSGSMSQDVPFTQTIPPTLIGPAFVGDVLEIAIPWKVINVEGFSIQVRIQSNNPGSTFYLSDGGGWVPGVTTDIPITRSKKKQRGSFTVTTDAIPKNDFDTTNYSIFIRISSPTGLTDIDGLDNPGVEIFPVKLGINNSSSVSLVTKATNNADFSRVEDEKEFFLFDNGDLFSSNVLTITIDGEHFPVDDWDSEKGGVLPADIEYHMTRTYVDQYAKSIRTWEGTLFSNTLRFYHLIEFSHIPNIRFMQISDEFDNEACEHSIVLQSVLPEGSASLVYEEYDVNEERD